MKGKIVAVHPTRASRWTGMDLGGWKPPLRRSGGFPTAGVRLTRNAATAKQTLDRFSPLAARPAKRWLMVCVLALCSLSLTAQPLRFGQAAVDITPPAEMPFQVPQRPPFQVVAASGTHDPLQAKAVVFESGVCF